MSTPQPQTIVIAHPRQMDATEEMETEEQPLTQEHLTTGPICQRETTEQATAAPPARRQHFDRTTVNPALQDNQSPLAYALSMVERHTASLHVGIAQYLSTITKEWLSFAQKIEQKRRAISRMEEPDYIPPSARVKFELKSNEEVEQQAEFTSLQENVTTAITTLQSTLKTQIVEVAKLELKMMQHNLNKTLATALYVTTLSRLLGF